MKKAELIKWLDKIPDNEPLFCLRAQDQVARSTVKIWAVLALEAGSPIHKVEEALHCAAAMKDWPIKKVPD
jgi:hypothetical protein